VLAQGAINQGNISVTPVMSLCLSSKTLFPKLRYYHFTSFRFAPSYFWTPTRFVYLMLLFQLPVKIDIIKHAKEIDGKSTASHAAILAPDDVTIYTYPCIPNYNKEERVTF